VQATGSVDCQADRTIVAVDPQLRIGQTQPQVRQCQRAVILWVGELVDFSEAELPVFEPPEQLDATCPYPVDPNAALAQAVANLDQFGRQVRSVRVADHQIANDLSA